MQLIVTRNTEATHAFMQAHAQLIHPGAAFDVWLWQAANGVTIDDIIGAVGTDWMGAMTIHV